MTLFVNEYTCPRCGHWWQDEWSCMCDDRCPNCNLTCSPDHSEELNDEDESDDVPDAVAAAMNESAELPDAVAAAWDKRSCP